MVVLLLSLASLIAVGVAAARGWLPDTRDQDFALGRVSHPTASAAPDTGPWYPRQDSNLRPAA